MRHAFLIGLAALFLAVPADAEQPAANPFRDCAHCPEMVAIPAGTFTMGSADDEPGHDAIEGPQHAVSVPAFAAGRFDVTLAEWSDFAKSTRRPVTKGCQWTGKTGPDADAASSWDDLGFPQTPRDPVVCISWQDARDYADWLSRETGKRYRLLSEAEWEYAARACTTTPYYWGSGNSHEFANHGTEQCCGGLASGRDQWIKTSPGDAFPPNAFGLYDMSGNVLQWLEDCFSPSYSGLPADGSAFREGVAIEATGDLKDLNGTSTCDYRVVRGGDWGDQARWVRSASRSFAPPPGPGQALQTYRSGGVGFRVARSN
jgi:formylglycine-generating enzyme required for sulfatase activity